MLKQGKWFIIYCTVCIHMFVLYFIKDISVYYSGSFIKTRTAFTLPFLSLCLFLGMVTAAWAWNELSINHRFCKSEKLKPAKMSVVLLLHSQSLSDALAAISLLTKCLSWTRRLEISSECLFVPALLWCWYAVYLAWCGDGQQQTDGSAWGSVSSTCSCWHLVTSRYKCVCACFSVCVCVWERRREKKTAQRESHKYALSPK